MPTAVITKMFHFFLGIVVWREGKGQNPSLAIDVHFNRRFLGKEVQSQWVEAFCVVVSRFAHFYRGGDEVETDWL